MRAPSVKSLLATFPSLDSKGANLIRKLAKADRDKLESLIAKHCPETDKYARSCYHSPYTSRMWRVTLALHAIDTILGTHGVESIGTNDRAPYSPPYEYCNTGDSYAATLIYKRDSDNLFIGNWGTIAERMPAE